MATCPSSLNMASQYINKKMYSSHVRKIPFSSAKRDEHGRYRIPLTQYHGQWEQRITLKAVIRQLQLAHSVYNLPSKEEAIKWMNTVCGYPVKSMWIKAIKEGNYAGWLMLPERSIVKYHQDTNETPKDHLNQSTTKIRSTKPKHTPLEVPKTSTLQ